MRGKISEARNRITSPQWESAGLFRTCSSGDI
ncbi:hypothetical protein H206_05556 [Candidatus Electrothrix aarhusensis]|uniref:Uncharacterized protein n=1 Tax=Candidatus Electrothrix aarhusensis TaxID=1859131 RepID=A0A444J458_9BACT|nr:hypothetical protein H206_05556 [Candidatus Electrothrix aarhusensis]